MREAVIFHFDPLRGIDTTKMSALDRHEYFKRLAASADSMILTGYLDDSEVNELVRHCVANAGAEPLPRRPTAEYAVGNG